jgi:hypothetical protein
VKVEASLPWIRRVSSVIVRGTRKREPLKMAIKGDCVGIGDTFLPGHQSEVRGNAGEKRKDQGRGGHQVLEHDPKGSRSVGGLTPAHHLRGAAQNTGLSGKAPPMSTMKRSVAAPRQVHALVRPHCVSRSRGY